MGLKTCEDPSVEGQGTFDALDDDILFHVLSFLSSVRDILRCGQACKRLRRLVCQPNTREALTADRHPRREHPRKPSSDVGGLLPGFFGLLDASPHVRRVSIKGQRVTRGLIERIARGAPSLQGLDLSFTVGGNHWGPALLAGQDYESSPFPSLESLSLRFAPARCFCVSGSYVLPPRLHTLHLDDSGVGDVQLVCLRDLGPRLRVLDLRSCVQISSRGLCEFIPHCTQLEVLRLDHCWRLKPPALACIAKHCTRLQDLSLVSCQNVSDACVQGMCLCLPSLRCLDLTGCRDLTDAGLDLCRLTPGLEVLHLTQCANVTDHGVSQLAAACPSLRVLSLGHCPEVTDSAVGALAVHCTGLRELSLRQCGVTDPGVKALVKACTGLQRLDIGCCNDLSDLTLIAVAEALPHLASLQIEACGAVTDVGVCLLAAGCPRLREVSLVGCSNITDHAVQALATHAPGLESLSLTDCSALTPRSMSSLHATCGAGLHKMVLIGCAQATIDAATRLFPSGTVCV